MQCVTNGDIRSVGYRVQMETKQQQLHNYHKCAWIQMWWEINRMIKTCSLQRKKRENPKWLFVAWIPSISTHEILDKWNIAALRRSIECKNNPLSYGNKSCMECLAIYSTIYNCIKPVYGHSLAIFPHIDLHSFATHRHVYQLLLTMWYLYFCHFGIMLHGHYSSTVLDLIGPFSMDQLHNDTP